MNTSNLHIYSIGYVAEDIKENSLFLKVYPVETLTGVSGNLTDENDIQIETKDIHGKNINLKLKSNLLITAKWLPIGESNRTNPPMVCGGETVILWRFGDTDKYFWTNMYNEIELRKQEKILHMVSNKSEGGEDSDPTAAYYTLIDTINKKLILHTDDSDGEATKYDIVIDTSEGTLTVFDGNENMIELNSVDNTITIDAKQKLSLKADSEIELITPLANIKTETGTSIETKSFSVKNDDGELIEILADLVQAIMDEQHIGNMGAPTAVHPASISKYNNLKSKIESFKG